MLRDEETARGLADEIRPQDFTDPLFRRAAERIFETLRQRGSLAPEALLQEGDEELNRLVTHYSVLELAYEDPAKSREDCVALLKQQDPEKQMKQIVKALREAEEQGNADEYRRLLEMQQQLSRRPGRRIPGM